MLTRFSKTFRKSLCLTFCQHEAQNQLDKTFLIYSLLSQNSFLLPLYIPAFNMQHVVGSVEHKPAFYFRTRTSALMWSITTPSLYLLTLSELSSDVDQICLDKNCSIVNTWNQCYQFLIQIVKIIPFIFFEYLHDA